MAGTGLTVAVTGASGDVGQPLVDALERSREIRRIVAMGRRPLEPAQRGWRKTEYRRGDVLDQAAVADLVAGADVVVHLAFVVVQAGPSSRGVNVEGSRNVFAAAARAGAARLVYASSVAAYGFPAGAGLLDEDVPVLGNDRHPYSAHKAEVEAALDEIVRATETNAWVFRPSIVAGPRAPLLRNPYMRWADLLPAAMRALVALPDPGIPFQLVHHDDLANALRAGVLGRGEPGAYNVAAPGEVTIRDVAEALGMRAVRVPSAAVGATAEMVRLIPFLPAEATWIEAVRRPAIMDTSRARRVLRWRPRFDARETLRQTVAAMRGAAADPAGSVSDAPR